MHGVRVVYKVSGESLHADTTTRLRGPSPSFSFVAAELRSLVELGHHVVAVLGGGNLFRGSDKDQWHMTQREADQAGMIATSFNAVRLAPLLRNCGVRARVFAHELFVGVDHLWNPETAEGYLRDGGIVVVAGGVGLPYVSSDYAAVHYAVDIGAEVVLAAKTGTDGVYDSDPNSNPDARRYKEISASNVIHLGLEVMDFAAVELARRHRIRIDVFNAQAPGAARQAMEGHVDGTIIRPV